MNRRNTELGLILLAIVVTASAYVLSALGKDSNIPANLVPFLGAIIGLLVIAHIATRYLARGADSIVLPLAALLNGIGYVILVRLNAKRFAGPQATWTFIGIGAYVVTLIVVRRVNDLRLHHWRYFWLGCVLLMLPLVPGLGREVGGARIWVRVGPLGFQPGEIAKVCLAVFFAGYLEERRELIAAGTWRVGPFNLPEPKYLMPILAAWGVSVVLMVGMKDLGTALMFFTLFVVMLWVGTEKGSYLAIGALLFSGAAFVALKLITNVQNRVDLWIDPWSRYDVKNGGYQIIQAQFGIASGGLGGRGLGQGTPGKIPAAQNDFIFAAISEELGLFGATAVLMAFVLIIGSGLRTATKAERPFEKLLAVGLTTTFGVQAFIIIGGVLRVLPLTGVTLPFVSYGGSSLVANYVLLALLMRIGDSSARRTGELPDDVSLAERRAARRWAKAIKRGGAGDTTVIA
jgi:cell division protein FtsW (lipid II flippase)